MDNFYRHIEENFLTQQECDMFIKMSEEVGYEEAKISVGRSKEQVMNKDVRDNYRVILDDESLASDLWFKIQDLAPKEEGWEAVGLNERLRFYRYEFGQQFKRHVDGAFKRNDNEISFVTVIFYLNDNFDGGATQFIEPFEMVQAKTGNLLMFKHRQLHQGDPVTKGTKYVLRTDIMYRKK